MDWTNKRESPGSGNRRRVLRLAGHPVAVVALLAIAFGDRAAAQGTFKIESAGPPPAAIPREVTTNLQADGTRLLRVVNGIDKPLAELWWVRKLPLRGSHKKEDGAAYGELVPGRMVAVLRVVAPIEDLRNQKLAPGFYTARYAQLDRKSLELAAKNDADDDEKGRGGDDVPMAVEYRDYVALARLESDTQTGAKLSLAKLFQLSRRVLRSREPVMLALPALNPAYRAFPYAVSDDLGNCAVQFKIPARVASGKTGELRIAILLVNPPNVSKDD